jgi:putative transcriptional regulator
VDTSLAGKLLIAMPGIGDPRFEHAVIMMCVHTSDQAMGLVVNKPKGALTLKDVLDHLGVAPRPELAPRAVLDGGPVKPDRGFVLHSEDFAAPDRSTQKIAPGVRLSTTRDVLDSMAGDNAPAQFVLALGYAGWDAGQLENELIRNVWIVAEPDRAIIFGDDHEQKWTAAIASLGFDPAQLLGEAGRA